MLIISKIFLRSNKQIFFAKTELAIRYCYGIKKYTTDQKLHYLTLSTDEAKDFKKNLKIFENLLIKYAPYGMKLQDFYDILDDKYDPKKEKILYTEEHVNSKSIHLPKLNFEYLKNNISEVENNVKNRKTFDGEINIQKNIIENWEKIKELEDILPELLTEIENKQNIMEETQDRSAKEALFEKVKKLRYKQQVVCWIRFYLRRRYLYYAMRLPNKTSPESLISDENKVIKYVNSKPEYRFTVIDHHEVGKRLKLIRESNIAHISGRRTYYLTGALADLEQALIQFTIHKLRSKGFQMISCPTILHGYAFESCGFGTSSRLLYRINPQQNPSHFLSGTSEVAIAAYFTNSGIDISKLPLRICCLSNCLRKETDNRKDRRGIFRVHHFNKVEMFGITANETGTESEKLFEEFMQIQEEVYSDLGLHFRAVEMSSNELGLSAYRKVDMEAWMPGRKEYAEISSASNCTDFQSRRFHILTKQKNEYNFAHTINATACAVPRLIISILEQFQTYKRTIKVPEVLHPYMFGVTEISKDQNKGSCIGKLTNIGPRQPKEYWQSPE